MTSTVALVYSVFLSKYPGKPYEGNKTKEDHTGHTVKKTWAS